MPTHKRLKTSLLISCLNITFAVMATECCSRSKIQEVSGKHELPRERITNGGREVGGEAGGTSGRKQEIDEAGKQGVGRRN